MSNRSKINRHIRKSNNYKIADFVLCEDWECPSNTVEHGALLDHYHALIYKPGLLESVEIERMKNVMKELGFEGDLDVEYVTQQELNHILKKRYLNQKEQQKIIDQSDAEFMATIQEREK